MGLAMSISAVAGTAIFAGGTMLELRKRLDQGAARLDRGSREIVRRGRQYRYVVAVLFGLMLISGTVGIGLQKDLTEGQKGLYVGLLWLGVFLLYLILCAWLNACVEWSKSWGCVYDPEKVREVLDSTIKTELPVDNRSPYQAADHYFGGTQWTNEQQEYDVHRKQVIDQVVELAQEYWDQDIPHDEACFNVGAAVETHLKPFEDKKALHDTPTRVRVKLEPYQTLSKAAKRVLLERRRQAQPDIGEMYDAAETFSEDSFVDAQVGAGLATDDVLAAMAAAGYHGGRI